MASTVVIAPPQTTRASRSRIAEGPWYGVGVTGLLTLLVPAVHGYHPFAEDGGLYLAGVKYLLQPSLYPRGTEFVTAHLRYSIFAPLVATLTRATGAPLELVVFLLYLASVWLTLAAAWSLARTCFETRAECTGSVLLLACWMSLPIAGTSLMLADPYLTARSLSTPCVLLALGFALRWQPRSPAPAADLMKAAGSLLLAAAFHPLMAIYGAVGVLSVLFTRTVRPALFAVRMLGLLVGGMALAALLQHLAVPDSPAAEAAATSRDYWYLAEWRWFELLGLAGPLAVLAAFARSGRGNLRRLAIAAAGMGLVFAVVAVCFARPELSPKAVARLQPVRSFQIVYLVMIVALGAALDRWILRQVAWRGVVAAVLLSAPMFLAERAVYPASPHLERAGESSGNPWGAAFRWVSRNTPRDALFALDANYINRPHEDAHSFRAIAERSMLPDLSKDGGETAITPRLATAWQAGVAAQRGLSDESDAERRRKLLGTGVSWLVLETAAKTAFTCPYHNAIVKVCRLTP